MEKSFAACTVLQDSSSTKPRVPQCKGAVGVLVCLACCSDHLFTWVALHSGPSHQFQGSPVMFIGVVDRV